MSIRSVGYSVDEDFLLCQMYLDISQDPITGVYQSSDQFWSRVVDTYNNAKVFNWEIRNKKSLQHRFANIEKAVKKLNGCVRQVEMLRPSGASEQDIVSIYFVVTYILFVYIYLLFSLSFFKHCSLHKQKFYLCKIQTSKKDLNLIMCGL